MAGRENLKETKNYKNKNDQTLHLHVYRLFQVLKDWSITDGQKGCFEILTVERYK